MSARTRLSSAAAISVAVAVTTSTALLLAGCGPTDTTKSATPANSGAVTVTPTGGTQTPTAKPTASPTPTGAAPSPTGALPAPKPTMNGTANTRLTISNGTNHVLMNGTSVDFGTIVRDLSWSPDGAKAAFINGSGDLVTSNPDGSGRVVVAKNPGGQTWSHPTWHVIVPDPSYGNILRKDIFFAVSQGGVSRLEGVAATVADVPKPLFLDAEGEQFPNPIPQTGNSWPSAGGGHGAAVYANTINGEVYIRDDSIREQVSQVGPGSEPAISPDGKSVVFVRSSGGHDHVFEQSLRSKSAAKDLTPNATTDYTEPTWSPDGRTIALRTPDGISTMPADGSAAPTQVSTFPGLPAYRA